MLIRYARRSVLLGAKRKSTLEQPRPTRQPPRADLGERRPRDDVHQVHDDGNGVRADASQCCSDGLGCRRRIDAVGTGEEHPHAITFVDHLPAGDRQAFQGAMEDVRMD